MILKVPFTYKATVHKKRFKNPSVELFHEWIDVEIAEIDDIDAPVATQWHDETPDLLERLMDRERWGAVPQDGVCQTRWFNNDHWWPVLEQEKHTGNYEKYFAEQMTADKIQDMISKGESRRNPLVDTHSFTQDVLMDTEFKGNPLIASEFKSVIESNREQRLTELEERLKDLILIDNKAWKRGRTPVAYIKHTVQAGNENLDVVSLIKILPEDHPTIKNPLNVFSLAQFDDAREKALKTVLGPVDDPNASTRPMIFIEASIANNTEKRLIVDIAHKVDGLFSDYHSKEYRKMNELDPETGIAYFEFRRALLSVNATEQSLDELAEAMARFEPLCSAAHDQSGALIKNALERWEWRPLDISNNHHL